MEKEFNIQTMKFHGIALFLGASVEGELGVKLDNILIQKLEEEDYCFLNGVLYLLESGVCKIIADKLNLKNNEDFSLVSLGVKLEDNKVKVYYQCV